MAQHLCSNGTIKWPLREMWFDSIEGQATDRKEDWPSKRNTAVARPRSELTLSGTYIVWSVLTSS
jgi:hypothetical protein